MAYQKLGGPGPGFSLSTGKLYFTTQFHLGHLY